LRSFATIGTLHASPTPKRHRESKAGDSSGSRNDSRNETKPKGEPSLFKDLGATRPMKIFILVCIGVIGTVESIGYGTWAWRKYSRWKDSRCNKDD